jgi:BlaI family transcriptional regulator, penicillinase repressor
MEAQMAKNKKQNPTEKELAILKVLWSNGPYTVRQVNEQINKKKQTGYTTTLKLMQIMTDKGLLVRDDSEFKHIYKPAVSAEKTEKQIVSDMLDNVFAGSAANLVMRALSAKHVTAEELKKIRQLLDQMEK